VPWVEVFTVFVLSHLAGDFLLQTEWQATHKRHGLGRDGESRRALLLHIATYTLAFVPGLVWIAGDIGAAEAVGVAALIALPHMVEDDGRLLAAYVHGVKKTPVAPGPLLLAVDQTFHLLALFLVALLVGD
jgi:hypothetical protein